MTRAPLTTLKRALTLVTLALLSIALVACPTTPTNHAPQANDQTVTTNEDTPIEITLNITDPDGDDLTCTITKEPEHGTLTGTEPDLTYTPVTNYAGSDTFTYTTCDGKLTSDEATVTITITSTNDAPVAQDQTVSTPEDTPVDITLTATDPEGDDLTYTIASQPSHGALTGKTPTLTYTPDTNYTGSDTFSFTANDDELTSNEASVTIQTGSINDPPAADDQTISTAEDTPVTITLTATDPDGDDLTYAIVAGPEHGTLTDEPPNLTYTPDANFTGGDTFTFTANDGVLTSNEATVTIDIGGTNDAPTNLTLETTTVPENAAPPVDVGTLATTDPDPGNDHTYDLVAGPGDDDNDDFTITGDTLQTTAAFNHEATPSKTIRIRTTDPLGAFYEATFTITIENVNEFPTSITLQPSSLPENESAGTLVGTLTTTDPDAGDTHTYTLANGDGDDDNHRFTLTSNELRTAEPLDHETTPTLTVRVLCQDHGGLGIEQAITITVEDVNEPPDLHPIEDQEASMGETIVVTLHVDDESSDSVSLDATSSDPSLVREADITFLGAGDTRTLRITPVPSATGTVTITVTAIDASGLDDSETFDLSVTLSVTSHVLRFNGDPASGNYVQIEDAAGITFTASTDPSGRADVSGVTPPYTLSVTPPAQLFDDVPQTWEGVTRADPTVVITALTGTGMTCPAVASGTLRVTLNTNVAADHFGQVLYVAEGIDHRQALSNATGTIAAGSNAVALAVPFGTPPCLTEVAGKVIYLERDLATGSIHRAGIVDATVTAGNLTIIDLTVDTPTTSRITGHVRFPVGTIEGTAYLVYKVGDASAIVDAQPVDPFDSAFDISAPSLAGVQYRILVLSGSFPVGDRLQWVYSDVVMPGTTAVNLDLPSLGATVIPFGITNDVTPEFVCTQVSGANLNYIYVEDEPYSGSVRWLGATTDTSITLPPLAAPARLTAGTEATPNDYVWYVLNSINVRAGGDADTMLDGRQVLTRYFYLDALYNPDDISAGSLNLEPTSFAIVP